MVIKSVELEIVCGVTSTIPDTLLGEVAFAGKSNVGKSSLINALMNRKSLARISSQPGKTQTINFYNINQMMYLVDLPGYGYANANEEIKAQWGQMIEKYLHTSKQLRAVFLLIDIRHVPSENDELMYQWMLNQGFEPIIVATKADKLTRGQIPTHIKQIEDGLGVVPGTMIIPFSAETKEGRAELWDLIDELVLTDEQKEAIAAEALAKQEEKARKAAKLSGESTRKPRWKDTDKPVAKKTKQKASAKKAQAKEASAKFEKKQWVERKKAEEEAARKAARIAAKKAARKKK